MLSIDSIQQAASRIEGKVLLTPTIFSPGISELLERTTYLKLENLQISGSFKPRGVLNKLLALPHQELRRRMVAVSGGNFGIALAEAGAKLGADVSIVLPESVPKDSAARIQAAGATVIWEQTVKEAFNRADQMAAEGDLLIDDCDDPMIAAGSGTIALEMYEAQPKITDVFASVGGGSMISGVATALKTLNPKVRVWGVESNGADSMSRAIDAGKPIEVAITSSIATLGVPIVSKFFLEHVQTLVHQMVVVSDNNAIEGVLDLAQKAHIWAEPAAGTLIPAIRQVIEHLPNDAVLGLVVCGGNSTIGAVTVDRQAEPG